MFISEMSETSIRGALASLMQLMSTFGLLFVDALNINGVVHWNYISAICISIPGIRYSGIVSYLNVDSRGRMALRSTLPKCMNNDKVDDL